MDWRRGNVESIAVTMEASSTKTVQSFAAKLKDINCMGDSIQVLSAMMRNAPPQLRTVYLNMWSEHFRETTPNQLLAMIYLANDVIQMVRKENRSHMEYKYLFALELAKCLKDLYVRHPSILSETFRVLEILRTRCAIDSKTIDILGSATHGKDVSALLYDHVCEQQRTNFAGLRQQVSGLAPSSSSVRHPAAVTRDLPPAPLPSRVPVGSEAEVEDDDIDTQDATHGRRIAGLVTTVGNLRRDIRDKDQFAQKLVKQNLKTVDSSRGSGAVSSEKGSVVARKLELLKSKEWQLRAHYTQIVSDVFSCLDTRHQILVTRLGMLSRTLEVMKNVDGGGSNANATIDVSTVSN